MSNEILENNFQTKLTSFIKKNLKNIIISLIVIIISVLSFLFIKNLEKKNNIKISEKYTKAKILLSQKKINLSKNLLEEIINEGNKFYSPLALYLVVENNMEMDSDKIIIFFDQILKINSIDKENLNLINIKKAIYLFNTNNEELIVEILNPIINSSSVWKNVAINLITEYFLSKGQKVKANEYIQLLNGAIKK
tara:strand:- start:3781 stop:4362 length:582 start_codon:yes stop_codon:yes gene_type:complete